ncbi:hypothetical protein CEP53_010130 [Fusarium sp. AF-6]|nr:hypothetical protein CEP53_010130 [Fusarium sp. AF-6]
MTMVPENANDGDTGVGAPLEPSLDYALWSFGASNISFACLGSERTKKPAAIPVFGLITLPDSSVSVSFEEPLNAPATLATDRTKLNANDLKKARLHFCPNLGTDHAVPNGKGEHRSRQHDRRWHCKDEDLECGNYSHPKKEIRRPEEGLSHTES